MAAGNNAARGQGLGVDITGGPVVDPTRNVLDLFEAGARRQDDLRAKDREISDIQHRHQEKLTRLLAKQNRSIGKLREEYQEKIAHAESGRLDSIRQVDREEVAKTAVSANNAITVLAKQTTDLALTLDKKVSDTAVAAEQRNSTQYSDTNKRLSALELSSSEGKGKQQVSDPAMERLAAVVEKLAASQSLGTGKSEGIDATTKIVLVGAGLLLSFLAYQSRTTPPAPVTPQVIMVPAPVIAPPTTTTTTTIPAPR